MIPEPPKSKKELPFSKRLYGLIKHFLAINLPRKHDTDPNLQNSSSDCKILPTDLSNTTYDKVYITDSAEMYQWASKDTFIFTLFKFLQKYKVMRYILDGACGINPAWHSVLWADKVVNGNEPIEVTDTLVLHCASIESYSKVIPRIRGSYHRLVLHGHMSWHQVKKLIHPGVKQVRINATFEIVPVEIEYENFVNFILNHSRGFEYKFCIAYESKCPEYLIKKLDIALRSHKSHTSEVCADSYSVVNCVATNTYMLFMFLPMLFLVGFCYSLKSNRNMYFWVSTLIAMVYSIVGLLISVFVPMMDIKKKVNDPDWFKPYSYLYDI